MNGSDFYHSTFIFSTKNLASSSSGISADSRSRYSGSLSQFSSRVFSSQSRHKG
nr:MAG TPA: hypothetical protein [Caudoviricetes sp.]